MRPWIVNLEDYYKFLLSTFCLWVRRLDLLIEYLILAPALRKPLRKNVLIRNPTVGERYFLWYTVSTLEVK